VIIENPNGLTVGELREFIKGKDDDDEVWVCDHNGLSNEAIEVGDMKEAIYLGVRCEFK
jgi:hypothetical protein